ncbi:MAG TPA: YceI family protein [Solirubrobacteraceae bacterium]|nr:YceI family protein [Solirubrobacteraceae bacterium]
MTTTTPQATDTRDIESSGWRIDPTRSGVEFRARSFWGLVTVSGRFERYSGTLDLRGAPAIELTIEAGSLNTKNKLRDKHLRSGDFFDTKNHPDVRFVSDYTTLDGERLLVHGRLHAAGKSMPLDINATLRRVGDELQIDARTAADYPELGMSRGTLGMIRTPVELIVHGRLVRDAA